MAVATAWHTISPKSSSEQYIEERCGDKGENLAVPSPGIEPLMPAPPAGLPKQSPYTHSDPSAAQDRNAKQCQGLVLQQYLCLS